MLGIRSGVRHYCYSWLLVRVLVGKDWADLFDSTNTHPCGMSLLSSRCGCFATSIKLEVEVCLCSTMYLTKWVEAFAVPRHVC